MRYSDKSNELKSNVDFIAEVEFDDNSEVDDDDAKEFEWLWDEEVALPSESTPLNSFIWHMRR